MTALQTKNKPAVTDKNMPDAGIVPKKLIIVLPKETGLSRLAASTFLSFISFSFNLL